MHAHIHPSQTRFTSPLASGSVIHPDGLCVPWWCLPAKAITVPRAPSPGERCYLPQHGIRTHVGRHYPAFLAPTGSCAGATSSHSLGFTLVLCVLAGCCAPLLDVAPSQRYLRESFPRCLHPYPGGPPGALTRFFPGDFGLRHVRTDSALNKIRTATSVREIFRGCSEFVMFRPPGWLATPVAPTTMWPISTTPGSRGFYVPAYLGLLPPRAGDMLAARIGQLTAWGLSPH